MLPGSTYLMLYPMLATSDEKALGRLAHLPGITIAYIPINVFSVGRESLPDAKLSQYSDLLHNEDSVHVEYFLDDCVKRHGDVFDRNGCGISFVCLSKGARESLNDSMYLSAMN